MGNTKSIDRVQLLKDTVNELERQKNFPYSEPARTEWEMAYNEAKKMYDIESKQRKEKK